jgi:phosphomannomutase
MKEAYFQYLILSIPKCVHYSSNLLTYSQEGSPNHKFRPTPYETSSLRFINTSMHGVSHPFVSRAFSEFGLPEFIPVKEQMKPDPDFPTVSFPNPEEKGGDKT